MVVVATVLGVSAIAGVSPGSAASAPVYAAGYGTFQQSPSTLALWASDALVHLGWQHWGSATTTGHGGVTEHSGGVYRTLPATVQLSQIQFCGGRRVYTHVSYEFQGRWQTGHRNGCRLAA